MTFPLIAIVEISVVMLRGLWNTGIIVAKASICSYVKEPRRFDRYSIVPNLISYL